jgi:hypothetical protein
VRGVKKKKVPKAAEPVPGSFLIHRKYAPEPVRCGRHADLKQALGRDMAELSARLDWFGNTEDAEVFEALSGAVGKLAEAGEGAVDMLADPRTGVRYQVRVERVPG